MFMHKLLVLVLTLFSFFTLKAASSLPALQTLQLSSAVKDLVWDATRARYLVAVDGAILTVDPERVSVDGTLAVGEAIDKIAISDDGQYVYALINARGAIKRYRIRDNTLDLEMSLGHTQYGYNRTAKAIAVVPISMPSRRNLRTPALRFKSSTRSPTHPGVDYGTACPRISPFRLSRRSMLGTNHTTSSSETWHTVVSPTLLSDKTHGSKQS